MSWMDDDDSTDAGSVATGYAQHIHQQAMTGGGGGGGAEYDDDEGYYQSLRAGGAGGGGYGETGNSYGSPSSTRQTALEDEVKQLREMLRSTSQGAVEAKYLEQLRKNRELSTKLESERTRNGKLSARVVQLEREKLDRDKDEKKGVLLPSQRGISSAPGGQKPTSEDQKEAEFLETKNKLARANKTIATLRQQIEEQKRSIHRMKKVVAVEIGDDDIVDKALDAVEKGSPSATPTKPSNASTVSSIAPSNASAIGGAGWRGRAQQIALLKSKVKDLEVAVANSTVVGSNASVADMNDFQGRTAQDIETATAVSTRTGVTDVDTIQRAHIAKREQARKTDLAELDRQVKERDEMIDREKKRADSVTARLGILERDNAHLKNCIQRIVEKTENDDKLIAAYKAEIDQTKRDMRDALMANQYGKTTGYGIGPSPQALQAENAQLADQISELRTQLHFKQKELDEFIAMGGTNATTGDMDAMSVTTGGGRGADFVNWLDEAQERGMIDETSALMQARLLIDEQREALLAFETQLQKKEKLSTAGADAKALSMAIREENAALKERVKSLSSVMDKEISMYKTIAEEAKQKASAAQSSADASPSLTSPVTEGQRGTPIAGRRSSARPGSANSTVTTATTAGNSIIQEEYHTLKQQYAELKRAYNSQQSKMQQQQQ